MKLVSLYNSAAT